VLGSQPLGETSAAFTLPPPTASRWFRGAVVSDGADAGRYPCGDDDDVALAVAELEEAVSSWLSRSERLRDLSRDLSLEIDRVNPAHESEGSTR
jgi:hypothetical protein